MEHPCFSSASTLVKEIKSRNISSVEVVKLYLRQIEKINPLINALVQRYESDEILKQAEEADKKVKEGAALGKLHGIPITIKDAFQVKGLISCCAHPGLYREKAKKDATAVKRLRDAGAIILGLTNVSELLIGVETDNLMYGQTKNPYDLSRTPGGSSGGCAALIAAGGSALSLSSDGGGSLRWPAHCSGIATLKPTQYTIPTTGSTIGEVPGIFGPYVISGPMARSVDDLILAISILAGPDNIDPHTLPLYISDTSYTDISSLKIAFFTDNGVKTPSDSIQKAITNVIESLKSEVKSVEERTPKGFDQVHKLLWETIFLGGDRGKGFKMWLENSGTKNYSEQLKNFISQAEDIELSVTELRIRFVAIDRFRKEMLRFMQDIDVVICPVAPTVAPKHGTGLKHISDYSYTMAYTLSGAPVAVVRCSTSDEGLPIGVQIAAKPFHDNLVLSVAKRIEEIFCPFPPPKMDEERNV